MSEWTNVRCIYDLSNGWFPDKDIIAGHMGIMTRFQSAKDDVKWNVEDNMFNLGSEGGVDVYFYPKFYSSESINDLHLHIDDRGTLVLIGNLRDCNRDEFVRRLNIFLQTLNKYGIIIDSGLVSIE